MCDGRKERERKRRKKGRKGMRDQLSEFAWTEFQGYSKDFQC